MLQITETKFVAKDTLDNQGILGQHPQKWQECPRLRPILIEDDPSLSFHASHQT